MNLGYSNPIQIINTHRVVRFVGRRSMMSSTSSSSSSMTDSRWFAAECVWRCRMTLIVFMSMTKMPFDMFDLMQYARVFLAQNGSLLLEIWQVDFTRLIELKMDLKINWHISSIYSITWVLYLIGLLFLVLLHVQEFRLQLFETGFHIETVLQRFV